MFGFSTLDTRLRITQWNSWLAEWTGRPAEEVLGRPLQDAFPEVEQRGILDALRYALEFSAPITLSWRFHKFLFASASGETVPQSALAQPMYERETLTGMVVAVQDVRDRQMAENELRLRIRQLETLHEIDRLILQDDLDAVLETLVQRLTNLFKALHAEVFLLEGEHLVLRAACNWLPGVSTTRLSLGEGIVGQVALHRRSFFSLDVSRDTRYLPVDARTRAEGAVPIISEGGVLYGVINMESAEPQRLISGGVQEFIEALAQQVAIAIERAAARRSEEKRVRALSQLRSLGVQLAGVQRITEVYDLVVQVALRLFEAESVLLYMREPESGETQLSAAHPEALFSAAPVSLPQQAIEHVQDAETLVWPVGEQPNWVPPPLDGIHTLALLPLRSKGQLLSVMCLGFTSPRDFEDPDAYALTLLAEQLGAQVHAWHLQSESLRRLAELDALHQVSQHLRDAHDSRGLLALALDASLQVLHVSRGVVLAHAPHEDSIAVLAWCSVPENFLSLSPDALAGQVLHQRQPRLVQRVTLASLLGWQSGATQTLVDALLAPIDIADEGVALLVLIAPPERRLGEDDLRLLDTIAQMTSTAVQRAELHQRTRQQVERLMSLSQVTATINASLDLKLSLDVLLHEAQNQLQVDAVAVYLFSEVERRLRLEASVGLPVAEGSAWDVSPLNQPLPTRTRLVLDLQLQHDALGGREALRQAGFRTWVGIPLIIKAKAAGMLECLWLQPHQPDAYWMEFAEILGRITAMAVDMAQMFTRMQQANVEMRIAYDATIEGWAKALELRDNETKGHSDRVTDLTVQLAGMMGFDSQQLTYIRWGALLHDIGKMGIPDSILHKPGPLTPEE